MAYSRLNNRFDDEGRPEKNIVRAYLNRRKLTQKEFADRIGVSIGAVAQWLSGKRKIPGPVKAYIELSNSYRLLQSMNDSKTLRNPHENAEKENLARRAREDQAKVNNPNAIRDESYYMAKRRVEEARIKEDRRLRF